ncbi:YkoF family thiamine/hydroxymethylpyrimidine-binding protein [Candidatus Francisella endociliophora]|nr:YkoF family thiamine/hydroxymethylpyrimidine-binding protein [Francisella sp. FSC1006]
MTDNYTDVIINALKEIKPYQVKTSTDDVSTTVIGNIDNVFNYISNVYTKCLEVFDGHIAMSTIFSIGCPGEEDDKLCHPSQECQEINIKTKFDTAAQFAIMPLKNTEYMDKIYKIINKLKSSNLNYKHKHFCSYLRGDFIEVIKFIKESFYSVAEDTNHVVMTANFSNRSPSH